MSQYNTLNVKLSNSKFNKLKSEIKITGNLSLNAVGESNDETNFPDKLLLTNTQVSKICHVFANGSSANIKFSKSQLSKIIQSGGFLGRRLLKTGFSLRGSVLKPEAKSVIVKLG